MNIKGKKVLIHGVDITSKIESIYETNFGYRVNFSNGQIGTYNKSDAEVLEVKPFDISEHEFSDNDISLLKLKKRELYLSIKFGSERDNTIAVIDKKDAIAIAKALGVTGEDLL
ncbi:hypothetical protein [Pseudoalteromonas marina]|uniref:hypothetical protein n=1 Tax=Pseudoalteromonas marina TaxID=267375 RepID=UPI0023F0CDA5|nr:hypothetical protein [Pseudoalteromonas marina]